MKPCRLELSHWSFVCSEVLDLRPQHSIYSSIPFLHTKEGRNEKRKLFYTLGAVALAIVAFAARPAGAQTTANGPYYATPSWDQKLQCDTQTTCPRLIVLSNWNSAAVLDRETGLVWEKSPSTGLFEWFNAQIKCNQLNVGNRRGWRLPTVQELASLVDGDSANTSSPRLPPGDPFTNVLRSGYWSATTNASTPSEAWGVNFLDGATDFIPKILHVFVWCVRGGQGVDPQ